MGMVVVVVVVGGRLCDAMCDDERFGR